MSRRFLADTELRAVSYRAFEKWKLSKTSERSGVMEASRSLAAKADTRAGHHSLLPSAVLALLMAQWGEAVLRSWRSPSLTRRR